MSQKDLVKLTIDKSVKGIRPVRHRKPYYRIAVAVIITAGIVSLYLCGFLTPAVPVEVVVVSRTYPSQALALLNASGYVVAQRKAAVASKVTGRLVSLVVEEGSRIKTGEIIARLECEDVLALRGQAVANLNVARFNLQQAEAELHDATVSFHREETLLAKGVTSQAGYDTVMARYKKAKAAVAGAKASVRANVAALQVTNVSLEYTRIRAPFDAVVLTKNADIGDIVTPIGASADAKAAVVTIADMDSLQVEADVSESNLELVKVGQPCEIQLDALPGSRFRGAVHMIVPTADRSKATVMVKVRFLDKDSRVLPEMSAKVAFLSRPVTREEQRPLNTLNPAAIMTRDGRHVVFLIKDNRVVQTAITLGTQIGDMVEVLDGIKQDEKVVVKPLHKLKDGAKIKVVEK
ncbi:MAG: efflux transporter periplasmic adaptor subunit [Candidatus Brocadia carolinensis]|uniref:Efflux transporter periplasmic adaptor subunit n=1 Tax=Candidatus Brocadia carolinensis TaxID=1004156 RepID=A0A1V4AVE8_9BACT|nr:MAG: efflux transporter periplasmic adaptor subunit [Candidatus Brocadia caroliniensis]